MRMSKLQKKGISRENVDFNCRMFKFWLPKEVVGRSRGYISRRVKVGGR